ncbi:MAG: hypothetical protein R3244_14090, partial [Thermoanaerobaculia bacterium]|nr:hypothetical protein [Thermoanaerobaculia bacterium]
MDLSPPPQDGDGAVLSEASAVTERSDLLGLSRDEIRRRLGDRLDRPYRAEQIHTAIYRQG